MRAFKNILYALLLVILSAPLIQQTFEHAYVRPLSGAYELPDTVSFNRKNWFSGEFQEKYSPFYEYQIGYRPFFVRLRNELYFRLYNKSTNYVVVGKGDQLFAYDYWTAYIGDNRVSEDTIKKRIADLEFLNSYLAERGKHMTIVIAPNKVRHFSDYLPDDLENFQRPNNYIYWKNNLQSTSLNWVDFNAYYSEELAKGKTGLYPNTGTHWSSFGMYSLADTLQAIWGKYDSTVIQLDYDGWEPRPDLLPSDLDLINDMNLMFPMKRKPTLFPTNLRLSGEAKPLLVMGDSFFWNLYGLNEFFQLYHPDLKYWYYNSTQKDIWQSSISVWQLSPIKTIEAAEHLLLISTEANLHLFPFGFVKRLKEEINHHASEPSHNQEDPKVH